MKLRLPWSRKSSPERSSPDEGKTTKEHIEIDPKIPREAIHQSFKGNPGPCPKCGDELSQSRQTYLVATRAGKRSADSFVMASDFGWFCRSCPTIVINVDEVGMLLGVGKPGWDIGSEFVVLGIVDLDAVPKSKRQLPLGEPGNPVPLVEFSNLLPPKRPRKAKRPKKRRK